jgi:hypothetical protein
MEADRFGVSRPKDALAEVRAAVENWPKAAQEAKLSDAMASRIATDFILL